VDSMTSLVVHPNCRGRSQSQGPPNGALQTNKVLVHTGFIYPWSRLTNYSYENQYLMHTKPIKSWTPLHLHIRLFKRFQKGGAGGSVT
jgi:hypothetical protein